MSVSRAVEKDWVESLRRWARVRREVVRASWVLVLDSRSWAVLIVVPPAGLLLVIAASAPVVMAVLSSSSSVADVWFALVLLIGWFEGEDWRSRFRTTFNGSVVDRCFDCAW